MPFRQRAGDLAGSQRCRQQAMVSSVGPYRFSTTEFGAAFCHASALCWVSGSPQNRLQRKLGNEFGRRVFLRSMWTGTDGTENQTVSWFRLTNLAGARRSTGDMAYKHAPLDHAINMSNTER